MPIWKTNSAEETIEVGRAIGGKLKPGTVLALIGDLGSGKTTIIKGIGLGLGIKNKREIKSPTFVILHIYNGRLPLYHFDLYRIENAADLNSLGLDEFLSDPNAVTVIEWADRLQKTEVPEVPGTLRDRFKGKKIQNLSRPYLVLRPDIKIELKRTGEESRVIRLSKFKH